MEETRNRKGPVANPAERKAELFGVTINATCWNYRELVTVTFVTVVLVALQTFQTGNETRVWQTIVAMGRVLPPSPDTWVDANLSSIYLMSVQRL
jgi:hypothetical protein